MKKFHLNLQIIIALLVFCLTLFTSAKPVTRIAIANCYRNITAICPTSVMLQFNASDCTLALAQQGKGVIGGNSFISSQNCDLVQHVFCCAQLRRVTVPICVGHLKLAEFTDVFGITHTNSYAEISAVFCRTDAF